MKKKIYIVFINGGILNPFSKMLGSYEFVKTQLSTFSKNEFVSYSQFTRKMKMELRYDFKSDIGTLYTIRAFTLISKVEF